MDNTEFVVVNGKEVPIEGEKNLLELVRKAGVDIPTFCYHSDLSVYGACRLCLVDIEGMGIVTSCSTPPRAGMVVRTHTKEVRETRRLTVELLLADHNMDCPTCGKSGSCELQALAKRMGIQEVRFKPTREPMPIDNTNPSLVRDPNRCVLCGDCVRICSEVQGIAAIDFANRGSGVVVGPAFGKNLGDVECVYCGQCARVCPTGAITPKSEIEQVWAAIEDPKKTVVAQIAPAVRVALGECFQIEAGEVKMGEMVAALRAIGFDKVYDTSFTADLTVIEEANEFLGRAQKGEDLPQFTSCCPAWVKYAEQYYPGLLSNLSSCRSPQQMFGSLAKEVLPGELGIDGENLVVVSIMPCTAKKYEAGLDKFKKDGLRDVDNVLTTQELARMIEEAGLDFSALAPESLDMPFGFKTGAGVIFGASGGVSEAVLRYVSAITDGTAKDVDFSCVRGEAGIREASVEVAGKTVRLAVVHGLANAKKVADMARAGECAYDLIEVMACPGGCIGGAGQPVSRDAHARAKRTRGIYANDKNLQLHSSEENPYIGEVYSNVLGEVGGHKAHAMLHTHYSNRKRLSDEGMDIISGQHVERLTVEVCLGTSCHLRGAQKILSGLLAYVKENGFEPYVDIKAKFCMERCDSGPNVRIGNRSLNRCTLDMARTELQKELDKLIAAYRVVPRKTSYLQKEDFDSQVTASLKRLIETRIQAQRAHGCSGGKDCHGCNAEAGTDCIH